MFSGPLALSTPTCRCLTTEIQMAVLTISSETLLCSRARASLWLQHAILQNLPTVLVLYKRQCKAPWRHKGASGG